MTHNSIGFIGLGLMGGSLSIALRKIFPKHQFIGLDHNTKHCSQALSLGLVDEIVLNLESIQSCEVIFLSIPVDSIIKVINQLHTPKHNSTIIDLGSTKEKISNSIPKNIRQYFVTAHPMTGTEKFGPTAALDDLYKDKVVVLCDIELSGKHQQEVASNIFEQIGMKIVYMDAKAHDRHAAFISHMPHALSYALANTVMKQENNEAIISLAGGGFKSMSRIAQSSPNMWEDIFKQNKSNLIKAVTACQKELEKCQKMLEQEEWEKLNNWMQDANQLHTILE